MLMVVRGDEALQAVWRQQREQGQEGQEEEGGAVNPDGSDGVHAGWCINLPPAASACGWRQSVDTVCGWNSRADSLKICCAGTAKYSDLTRSDTTISCLWARKQHSFCWTANVLWCGRCNRPDFQQRLGLSLGWVGGVLADTCAGSALH